MRIDRASRRIAASAESVYRALTDRQAVESWLPPAGARGVVHEFEPRVGGLFRMTLVFDAPGSQGKSTENTDAIEGEFLALIPNEQVRQRFTFRSGDPSFAGAMTMTWTLTSHPNGMEVVVTAEDVPPSISPDDHQAGMASSLEKLARHVES